MIPASSTQESIENRQEHEGPVEVLMRLTATAGLLRSTDGRCYAKVEVGERREIYPYVNLNEPDFRLLIAWIAAALRPVGPYPVPYRRLLTLTKTNRPKTSLSSVSTTDINGCVDDNTFGEKPLSCA